MKRHAVLISLFLFLAVFLRFWQLGAIPSGLHSDEADMLYSAYSILRTGTTQYGEFNPLAIREHSGGTHPPLYTYALMPFLMVAGLFPYVSRIPSALFGSMAVWLTYAIARKLKFSRGAALAALALAAVNPWLLHMSRQGLLEAIALFTVMAGIWCLLKGMEKPRYILPAALAFGLSLFAYDAPKIFLPPFVLLTAVVFGKQLLPHKRDVLIGGAVLAVAFLLIAKTMLMDGETADFTMVSILDMSSITEQVNSERYLTNAPLWLSGIFHNKLTVALDRVITSYVGPMSVNWLFVNGDGSLQRANTRIGQYFLFELPLLLLGIVAAWKKQRRAVVFLAVWFFTGALPAAVTGGNYTYRNVLMLPVPLLLSGNGLVALWRWLAGVRSPGQRILQALVPGIILVYVSSYLVTYFFDYPVYGSEGWSKQQNEALLDAAEQAGTDALYLNGRWENQYAVLRQVDPAVFQQAYTHPLEYKGIPIMKLDTIHFGAYSEFLELYNKPDDYFPAGSWVLAEDKYFSDATPAAVYKDPGNVRVIFKLFRIP